MEVEILSDGRTVWVNSPDGVCLGRFSYMGIDIHKGYEGQLSGSSCLDCTSGPISVRDWQRFKEGMLVYHGVKISDEHAPEFYL